MPGNKHSGIKYIKNHILQTCGGQLLHRMSPGLLLLSCSTGIFSAFYFLIHVFCRFEIPPVRSFGPRPVIGGKFVMQHSLLSSDRLPVWLWPWHQHGQRGDPQSWILPWEYDREKEYQSTCTGNSRLQWVSTADDEYVSILSCSRQ